MKEPIISNKAVAHYVAFRNGDFSGFEILLEDGVPFTSNDSVICKLKLAVNDNEVPPSSALSVLTLVGVFIPQDSFGVARFLIKMTRQQSSLAAGRYITTPEITISLLNHLEIGLPVIIELRESTQ